MEGTRLLATQVTIVKSVCCNFAVTTCSNSMNNAVHDPDRDGAHYTDFRCLQLAENINADTTSDVQFEPRPQISVFAETS